MPTTLPPPFALTAEERREPLWLRLKAHLTEQLADAHRRNEAPLSDTETATIRGRIKCLRDMIALGADKDLPGH